MVIAAGPDTLEFFDRRSGTRPDDEGERRPLRIGFVNNMADAAFEDTYQQFADLIRSGSDRFASDIRCYYIPTVPRSPDLLNAASDTGKL